MKTSLVITRLVEAARNPQVDPNQLASLLSQSVERIAGMSRNGPQALAILHNKFMRKSLDVGVAPRPRKKFSAATRAKISESQKKRWADYHKNAKKEAQAQATKTAKKKRIVAKKRPSSSEKVEKVPTEATA